MQSAALEGGASQQLHQSVSATVIGHEELEQMQHKSREILLQLEEKRDREADVREGTLRVKKQKPLTLEERFANDRKILSETSVDGLKQLNQRLCRNTEEQH